MTDKKPIGVDNVGRKRFDLTTYNEQAAHNLTQPEIDAAETKRRKHAGQHQTALLQRHNLHSVTTHLHHQLGTQRIGTVGDAGIRCDVCDMVLKDSKQYIDHINGPKHLKMLGQSTRVLRSNLIDVKLRLLQYARLNGTVACGDVAGVYRPVHMVTYDDVIDVQPDGAVAGTQPLPAPDTKQQITEHKADTAFDAEMDNEQADMAAMMGFGGFGTTSKKQ